MSDVLNCTHGKLEKVLWDNVGDVGGLNVAACQDVPALTKPQGEAPLPLAHDLSPYLP